MNELIKKIIRIISLSLCASGVIFGSVSCFGLDKDMGLTETPDIQAREGAGGTLENPAPLDPFQRYDLVLAANECRVFSMKVPAKWSWSISLTVANREEARRGKLTADIQGQEPNWLPLPGCYMSKTFDLSREGSEVRMGVGNPGDTKTINFQLCQTGAPLHVTLISQISATKALVVPGATPLPERP
jgi:hypothetical protein